jgi:hypothetical protein
MIIVRPFKSEHLMTIKFQPSQKHLENYVTEEVAKSIETAPGQAYTVYDDDEILVVAGVIDVGEGRGYAWSYIAEAVGNRMVQVTRAVKRYLRIAPFRRIEMSVDCDFLEAHRWARMLGFSMEAERMRSYAADGRDCALYAMVKG